MINAEAGRLREPAAWLMIAVASTGVLVGVEQLLFGTSLGGSFAFRAATHVSGLTSPVTTALLVGAVLLAGNAGPALARLRLMTQIAVGTLALAALFGTVGLFGGLFAGETGLMQKVEFLLVSLPTLGLTGLALAYLLPRMAAAGPARKEPAFSHGSHGSHGSPGQAFPTAQPGVQPTAQPGMQPGVSYQGPHPQEQVPQHGFHPQEQQGFPPYDQGAPQGAHPQEQPSAHGQPPHEQVPPQYEQPARPQETAQHGFPVQDQGVHGFAAQDQGGHGFPVQEQIGHAFPVQEQGGHGFAAQDQDGHGFPVQEQIGHAFPVQDQGGHGFAPQAPPAPAS
ncbi:hypothetical protein ACFQ08_24475, partial [Streptosporangium algeriense]